MSVSELVRHYRKSLLARVNLLGSFHDRHLLYEAALSGRNLVLMCSRCVPFAEGPSLGTTVAKAKVRSNKAQSLRGRNPTFQKSYFSDPKTKIFHSRPQFVYHES